MVSRSMLYSNPHDFSHFIYEYRPINQPIKLTEPVKFYTKLGSPGEGSTIFKLDKQKKLHCSNMPSLLVPLAPLPPPFNPRLWQPIYVVNNSTPYAL